MSSDPLAWLESIEGIPSAFAAARDGIDAMLRDRGLRRTTPEQTAESLKRGALASASLESPADEAAALRISTELLGLVPTVKRAPLQALSRIHTLAAAGSLPTEQIGAPTSPESAARMQGLADTLLATEVPALMTAAIAHAEVAVVEPFASHNGLVARAFERLLIVARGVDPTSMVVPEAAHAELAAEYRSNLNGYHSGRRSGLVAWLNYAAEAYGKASEFSPLADGQG